MEKLSTTNTDKKNDIFPLSSAQERFWFLDKLEPNNSAYNVSRLFRIKGDLNLSILEESFGLIIKKHESFRTSFHSEEGHPIQKIHPGLLYKVERKDFSDIHDENERIESLKSFCSDELAKPFDLSNPPLFKINTFILGKNDFALLIIMHHIITDGWSLGILYEEINKYYSSLSKGIKDNEKLNYQYKDYAVEQKNNLSQELSHKKLDYWRSNLDGELQIIDIPSDLKRPNEPTFNGSRSYFSISHDTTNNLRAAAKANGCTLYMAIMAALKILVYRYTEVTDVIIGSPFANRNDEKFQGLVGVFINMIPLRTDLSGNPSYKEVLGKVRKTAFGAYVNQDYPFEQMVKELHPKRNQLHHPIFQIMLQYSTGQKLNLPDLHTEQLEIFNKKVQMDFSVYLWEWREEISGYLEFNNQIYSKSVIERFITHFKELCKNLSENPDTLINDAEFIPQDEKDFLLQKINATEKEYPKDICLHDLFDKTAEMFKDSVAIEDDTSKATYSELLKRSNRFANYLLHSKIKEGTLIGISADRSIEMTAALLGILKAGCTYVPLDPYFPTSRISHMMDDSKITVLITQNKMIEKYSDFKGRIISLDGDSDSISKQSSEFSPANISSNSLAYILYTSGSTGKPNGVMVSHRSLVNFLISMQNEPGINKNDILLSVTSLSFDISALEIFLPLISGAKLILVSKDISSDPKKLFNRLLESKTTIMQATPATWKMLLEENWQKKLGIKMLCGGEPLPLSLAKQILNKEDELWNMYGPTETTIWSSVKKISREDEEIFIGSPIANTQFYILDKNLKPVPFNIPGELYIGGDGLADGYFNNSELTEKRFINNPFGSGRIYKTGDQVRLKENREIEFLGRLDNQIKIRGFRIELGDIEHAASQHPFVADCAAAVKEIENDKKIVAYLILKKGSELSNKKLREFLSDYLPEYMLPSFTWVMDKFPLTPNGKIDRKNLPILSLSSIAIDKKLSEPNNKIEADLLQLWKSVLNINAIGVNDDFFELGGHSLLAAELFAKINQKFNKDIPISALFSASTIESLAKIISKENSLEASTIVPINSKGSRPPLFLIHGAGGNILLYRDLANNLGSDQPIYGVQSVGLNGDIISKITIEEMAAKYIKDIKKIQPIGPYYIGGYCMGGTVAFEMAQQLKSMGEEVALLAMLETYNLNGEKRSIISKYIRKFQNLIFHVENLLSLSPKEMKDFLSNKTSVEKDRLLLMLKVWFSRTTEKLGIESGKKYPHFHLEDLNDEAQLKYKPQKYEGGITLFRPIRHFIGANDSCFGWDQLATKGIETIKLNVLPRGMLVEPFVKELAAKLKEEISSAERKSKREPAQV